MGGADDTQARASGVALDSNGNIYLAGETDSASFPTLNAIQKTYGGGVIDAFALELNSAANALIYSTYLGGSLGDYAIAMSVDSAGNAYVSGTTQSANFPVYNAIQPHLAGSNNSFAAKIAPGGGSFVYSTYFGGNGGDFSNGSTIDSNGNFYIYGDTSSTSFPVLNAFQPTFCGWSQGQTVTLNHGWVGMLSPTGTEVYATYICGSVEADAVRGAAVDQFGDLFITGNTASTTFPTLNPIQAQYGGGASDSFVMELSPGDALLYSTYLGGNGGDVGLSLRLDSLGNIYVDGVTGSTNFPVMKAIQAQNAGADDAFLTKINAGGSAIVFSTYLGGSQNDSANGSAVDALANVYLAGQTASTNFPTLNALQPQYGGGADDAFLAVIATCSFTFSEPSEASAAGGSGNITITTTPECGWNATSNSAWITLTSSTSGQGDGSVSYSVAANTGATRSGTLTIAGNTITIAQGGTGNTPVVNLSASSLAFGNQAVATASGVQQVTLTNNGPGVLTISSIAVTGANPGDFPENNNCPISPATLAVSAACTLNLTFSPTAAGARSAWVTIIDNGSASPQSITLSGTGVTPVVTLSPTSLSGSFAVGAKISGTVTLTNTGPGQLSISSFAITGAAAGDYSQDQQLSCQPRHAGGERILRHYPNLRSVRRGTPFGCADHYRQRLRQPAVGDLERYGNGRAAGRRTFDGQPDVCESNRQHHQHRSDRDGDQ
ncbi:MAG TPA: SBBP repeat-containing protein [Bryobacteraceae bacterium]